MASRTAIPSRTIAFSQLFNFPLTIVTLYTLLPIVIRLLAFLFDDIVLNSRVQ